ncbi:hypothetical protein G7054_g9849 [Neopestalotiopsis clavispora]|nr:hypothetical protein G7054_g9849 [Neopestalotiopsis clavispora]
MSSADVPGSKKKKKNPSGLIKHYEEHFEEICVFGAALIINHGEALDELFRTIQSNRTKVASILEQNPDLCNMKSKPEVLHGNMSPGDFFQAEMLGYLSTPHIIQCLKKDDVPDVRTSSQRPLHVACLLQEIGVIEGLLSSGSDINATNDEGETPLGVACRAGLVNIAKLLLQRDAPILPDSADKSGKTPIMYLANREFGSNGLRNPSDEEIEEVAHLMSKAGFERYRNEDGFEIQSSCLLERLDDMKDDYGWTALKHAIARRDIKVVKLLLEAEGCTQHNGISGKHHTGRGAQDIAEERGDFELAKMIESFCSPESLPHAPRGWRSFKSPEESAKRHVKVSSRENCEISELIIHFGETKDPERVNWHHLPANNWRWLQLMLETGKKSVQDESLLQLIEKKFELSGPLTRGVDFFMRQVAAVGPRAPMEHDYRSLLTIVNIDVLEGYKDPTPDPGEFEATSPNETVLNNKVMELYQKKEHKGLLPSRTLDHYYQDDLNGKALSKLNESQVFTRYLENLPDSDENQGNDGNQPRGILVVSQFWLLRTNNSFVTSFPKRRGRENKYQNLELPDVIESMFRSTRGPRVIYHHMIKKAMQYQPSIMIRGKRTTYPKIFSREVQRISRKTDEYYDEFKKTLGVSGKHFGRLSNNATICLLEIDDVCNEVKIIQRVLRDRERVWTQLHAKKSSCGRMDDDNDHSEDVVDSCSHPLTGTCSWGFPDCTPNIVEASLRNNLLEIENTAHAVREKVHGLVALLHGQASTENALKASEQARYLLIFTLLTVVFSPLSFVTALLALQVESFTPTEWAQWDVTVACADG